MSDHVYQDGRIKCPKCGLVAGDDWTQCAGACPMTASPYFNEELGMLAPETLAMIGGLSLITAEPAHPRQTAAGGPRIINIERRGDRLALSISTPAAIREAAQHAGANLNIQGPGDHIIAAKAPPRYQDSITSFPPQMVPPGGLKPNIEDVFAAFLRYQQGCSSWQAGIGVRMDPLGKHLDCLRANLREDLRKLGIANHIDWTDRSGL